MNSIADVWYKKAINDSNNVFDKFICLWIAFNAIYGRYSTNSTFKNGKKMPKEKAQIKNCIISILNRSENRYQSLLDSKEFLYFSTNIIHDCRVGSDSNTKVFIKNMNSSSVGFTMKIVNLFFCIYQARCNLFHGNKTPIDYHDEEVVTNAANALESFLKIYFEEKTNVTID